MQKSHPELQIGLGVGEGYLQEIAEIKRLCILAATPLIQATVSVSHELYQLPAPIAPEAQNGFRSHLTWSLHRLSIRWGKGHKYMSQFTFNIHSLRESTWRTN